MIDTDKNTHLHDEFVDYIDDANVRDAYHVLLGAAENLIGFHCYPENKGDVRDFRFYTEDEKQPFAFIINKNSLLFYLRPPAVSSGKYSFPRIQSVFTEVNENPSGEWRIRVNDRNDALKIVRFVLMRY